MKVTYYFPVLVLVMIALTVLSKFVLNTDELMLSSLSEQLTQEQIQSVLDFNQKWEWLSYVVLPIILVLKITIISCVLWMGAFFFDKNITFKKLFTIITKAEFIFVVVGIVKLLWFAIQKDYTLQDIQFFYPLSALNIVGYEGLSPWFIYPFQTLNLFELIYWIALAWLLGKELQSTTDKALKIVASSYGSALLIWVVAIMFFTLNLN